MEMKEAELRLFKSKWVTAVETIELRDAQNAVLRAKLRRKLQQARAWKPMGRASAILRNSPVAIRKQSKLAACFDSQHVATQTDNFSSAQSASLAKLNAQLDQYANELRDEIKGWVDCGACDKHCAWELVQGRQPCIHCMIAPTPGMNARHRN